MLGLGYNAPPDYPAPTQVQNGVTYAYETLTGVLVTSSSYPTCDPGSQPMDNLINSLSCSSTFMNMLGVASDVEARLRIYKNGLPSNILPQDVAPYAIITTGNSRNWERIGFGVSDQHDQRGVLQVDFESVLRGEDDEVVVSSTQDDLCDQIMTELLMLSGSGGFLSIESVERTEATGVSDDVYNVELLQSSYLINWR